MYPSIGISTNMLRSVLYGCIASFVQGCTSVNGFVPGTSFWPYGTVTTKDNQPFELSSPDQKLRITPGSLEFTPVAPAIRGVDLYRILGLDLRSEFLDIASGSSKMRIKLHPGELTEKGLNIMGATHGLCANIIGDWRDELTKESEYDSISSCTKHCSREVDRQTCNNGTCKTERVTETYDCGTGSHTVRVSRRDYVRHYEVGFMNPQKSTESLARLKATAPYYHEAEISSGNCH